MARTVRNPKIDTRSARAALAANKSGYWTSVARGCALGYRKGAKGGVWLAKFVSGDFRRETTLGPADDALDPDGITALSHAQAQAKARAWFEQAGREAAGDALPVEPLTVSTALDEYLADYERRGGKSKKETVTRINAFIRPELGGILVEKLTAKRLRDWHASIAAAPARLRTKADATARQTRALDPDDPDAIRRRRATANRTLTVLKAAINLAFREGKASSDAAWRRVQPFREADSAKVRYLSADEAKRLANATAAEFRPLVVCALLTGCRYGEIAVLRVSDFDAAARTITVRASKGGKPRHVVLSEDGATFFEQQTSGKPSASLIFTRGDGKAWGKSHQHRPLIEACKAAKIVPAASFHILRHTYASLLVMNGAPLQVVAANLGHADTRMTERHYAHLGDSYVAETIRAAMPNLGMVEKSNVARIDRATA